MRPIIGITMTLDRDGFVRPGADYSYIRSEYGEEVRKAGGEPIFLDYTVSAERAAELCQGIIISGGEDIDPSLYGQPKRHTKKLEPIARTLWEQKLIDACDKYERPILGICYGLQLLNIHYGGTLYQDIAAEFGSDMNHGESAVAALHEVTFAENFLGYKPGDTVLSASRHHQAAHDIAPGFKVVARASDGVTEAIAGRGHYGIQWHAESDDSANVLYTQFVQQCRTPASRVKPTWPMASWIRSISKKP
jgi:putative glutamine amidotransferase